MIEIPQNSESPQPQIIELDKWFRPLEHLSQPESGYRYRSCQSLVTLKIQEVEIPLAISLINYDLEHPYGKIRKESFQLAYPQSGYVVTPDDFTAEDRAKKITNAWDTLTDEPETSGILLVELDVRKLLQRDLTHKTRATLQLKFKPILEKIVCIVEYEPTGQLFEAQARNTNDLFYPPGWSWGHFYPGDTGPLADIPLWGIGNTATLPVNPEKLAKLKMKFVLKR